MESSPSPDPQSLSNRILRVFGLCTGRVHRPQRFRQTSSKVHCVTPERQAPKPSPPSPSIIKHNAVAPSPATTMNISPETVCDELIQQLIYTQDYAQQLIKKSTCLTECTDYLHSLIAIEKQLKNTKRTTQAVRSMFLESLTHHLEDQLSPDIDLNTCQATIDTIAQALHKVQQVKSPPIPHIKKILRDHNLHHQLDWEWSIRFYIEDLEQACAILSEDVPVIANHDDVFWVSFQMMEIEFVCNELKLNPKLKNLSTKISSLQHIATGYKSQLDTLDGELRMYYDQLNDQHYTQIDAESGRLDVFYRSARDHFRECEDAFVHDECATVVCDGLGSEPCSSGVARMIATSLHMELRTISLNPDRKTVNVSDLQLEILEGIWKVVDQFQKDMESKKTSQTDSQFLSATTATAEVRIVDSSQQTHRFFVFIGDSNARLVRPDGTALLLNPFVYPSFSSKSSTYPTLDSARLYPSLTLRDIQNLKDDKDALDKTGKIGRNVQLVRSCFSPRPHRSLFFKGGLAMLYINPMENDIETELMSDGVTDRVPPESISAATLYRASVTESLILRYNQSSQGGVDRHYILNVLAAIFDHEHHLYGFDQSEQKAIYLFRQKSIQWKATTDRETITSAAHFLLKTLQLPTSNTILTKIVEGCSSFIIDQIPFGFDTEYAENLKDMILWEQFAGLSSQGYQDILKITDDTTYINTKASPCRTSLESSHSLPVLMKRFVESSSGWSENKILDYLRTIKQQYDIECSRLGTGKRVSENALKSFIFHRLKTALIHRNIRDVMTNLFNESYLDTYSHLKLFYRDVVGISLHTAESSLTESELLSPPDTLSFSSTESATI